VGGVKGGKGEGDVFFAGLGLIEAAVFGSNEGFVFVVVIDEDDAGRVGAYRRLGFKTLAERSS
jgi:hypothetical protein